MIDLQTLGLTPALCVHFENQAFTGLAPARVVEEHRDSFVIATAAGEMPAQIAGRMRHEAHSREDLPAVGDWVAVSLNLGGGATIQEVMPRQSALMRRAPGDGGDVQILAANLDLAFVVTSLNRDFNLRRVERILTMVWESGAAPVVVLTKADLCDAVADGVAAMERVAHGVPVLAVSSTRGDGLDELRALLIGNKTAALLGSSGVGKSTLTNALLGEELLATNAIREDDQRGRHTTTHRQLVVLPTGGMIIDTPGMREIGLAGSGNGDALGEVFDDVEDLAAACRFADCTHQNEPGCAVRAAIAAGDLDPARLASFHKLERELAHLARRQDPELAANSKRVWKIRTKAMRRAGKKRP